MDLGEGLVVQSFLKTHGFFAVLPDEYFMRVHWQRLFALIGIAIQVPRSEADDAQSLLQSVRSENGRPQPDHIQRRRSLALLLLTLIAT